MANARSRTLWEVGSHLMATVCNCAFGSRGGFQADDFNPFAIAEKQKTTRITMREFFEILSSAK